MVNFRRSGFRSSISRSSSSRSKTTRRIQEREAAFSKPTASGQFQAGVLSAADARTTKSSVALRNIPFSTNAGRTVTLVPNAVFQIAPPSPALAGKLAVKSFAQQVASIKAKERQAGIKQSTGAVSPVHTPAIRDFPAVIQAKLDEFNNRSGLQRFISQRKQIFAKNVFQTQQAGGILSMKFLENALVPFGGFLTPNEKIVSSIASILFGGAGLFGLLNTGGKAAGAAATATNLARTGTTLRSGSALANAIKNAGSVAKATAEATPSLIKVGAGVGVGALGFQGFKFLSSKIPQPSDTTIADDARNAARKAGEAAGNTIQNVKDAAKEGFAAATNNAKEAVQDVVDNTQAVLSNSLSDAIGKLRNTATGAVSGIPNAIKDAITGGGSGGSLIEKLTENKGLLLAGAAAVAITGYGIAKVSE